MIHGDVEFQKKLASATLGLRSSDLNKIRKAREERDNLRIEELAEAFENLAVAVSAMAMTKVDRARGTHSMVTEYLTNSREWMRQAIRAFMTPNLHLVEGQVRQTDADAAPEERVRCLRCGNTTVCRDSLCPDWSIAIKHHIGKDEPEKTPPEDDYPRAA